MADYTTVNVVKAALGITSTSQDAPVGLAIAAASRLIDKHCGRNFTLADATVVTSRTYAADDAVFCTIDDVASATDLVVETRGSVASPWVVEEATAYQLEPLNGLRNGLTWPYTAVRMATGGFFPRLRKDALVRVTAAYGWAEVPAEIEQACLIQACRLLKRPESAMGVLGVTDVGVLTVSRGLDTDVAILLDAYVRTGGM